MIIMNPHKCDCNCNTKEQKEIFDAKNLLFAVLCSCKLPSINQQEQTKETTDIPNLEHFTFEE